MIRDCSGPVMKLKPKPGRWQKFLCWMHWCDGERKEEDLPQGKGTIVRYICPHCYRIVSRTLINREGIFKMTGKYW